MKEFTFCVSMDSTPCSTILEQSTLLSIDYILVTYIFRLKPFIVQETFCAWRKYVTARTYWTNDYEKGSESHNDPILLPYTNAKGLLDTDTKSIFYSNQNFDYVVDNSKWMEWFDIMDNYLKPSFCIHKQYDLIYGSHKTKIPTAYHRESHVFLYLPPVWDDKQKKADGLIMILDFLLYFLLSGVLFAQS